MQRGDHVLLRSSYRGVVRWCWPHHYVGESDGRHGIYVQPGAQGKLIKHVAGKSYLDRWVTDAPAFDHVWASTHVLRFMREGDEHTVEVFWDTDWNHLGWYVNLQAPTRIRNRHFDTTDWALDVWVEPDGSWTWKDEDDFVRAQELGVFDAEDAVRIRAEGRRVIAECPWPTGWEDWRPPTDWAPLRLPADWHVL